ncbi:MAG TPA: TolC family protein [Acidobacteriota bacterium]|nr:TolC family protein [Acidobacteriota bacterium]
MFKYQRLVPILLTGIALFASFGVAQNEDQTARPGVQPESRWWNLRRAYEARPLPPVSFDNSSRLNSLMRAGKLYLSLEDAIALALENNLDIELQRFGPETAASDLLRASGGGALRGFPLTVNELPSGVGGPASPILNLPATGSPFSSAVSTNLSELTSIVPAQSSAAITGSTPLSSGPAIPAFNPSLFGQLDWQHQTTLLVNPSSQGTSALTGHTNFGIFGFQKSFGAGTQFNATFNALSQNTNSRTNTYNPYASSFFSINLTQPLLRGFGPAVNKRFITIAGNNQRVSDLVFRQQVISTISGVIRLYFDLVTLQEDVEVKRQTVALAQRLVDDNREKVDQGTLAPIELVRAQAQMASARQDLANSEGFEQQQELVLKNVLSRRGTSETLLREAHTVPTTPVDIPAREAVQPIQELVATAYKNRPELEEGQLQVANSEISLKGSRNAMLPDIDLVIGAQNNGLGGQLNPLTSPGLVDPSLLGGLGTALAQIFRRNYPSYGIGIQVNLPLRNNIAEADYARDAIQFRQTQVRYQQLENQVRLEVEAALIALQRSRSAYDAAVEARKLQEQSLQIEMEKYANGVSTSFLVMQYQSFLAQARSTEVAAKSVYAKARNALERALGMTLQNHNIVVDEAFRGRVSRPPAALPPEVR